jgi:hypothetical protein
MKRKSLQEGIKTSWRLYKGIFGNILPFIKFFNRVEQGGAMIRFDLASPVEIRDLTLNEPWRSFRPSGSLQ